MRPLTLLLCLAGCVLVCTANAGHTGDPLSKEQIGQLYAWFDQLGLPDVTNRKYVRVWTGVIEQAADINGSIDLTNEGFLLDETQDTFRVLLPDWTVLSLAKFGTGPEQETFSGYRDTSFEQAAKTLLSKLRNKKASSVSSNPERTFPTSRLGPAAQVLSVARICNLRGMPGLAESLLQGEETQLRNEGAPTGEQSRLLTESQEEFGPLLKWQAFACFGVQGVSREQILARLRKAAEFRPNIHDSEVDHAIDSLTRSVSDQSKHPAVSATELASMPPEQRARELIWRLQDARTDLPTNHDQFSSVLNKATQWPLPETTTYWPDNDAYKALSELGFQAIPSLIDALDDDRLTRTLATPSYPGAPLPLTVAVYDLARLLINQIAGFPVTPNNLSPALAKDDEQRKTVRTEAEKWWKEVSTKGEKDFLIEHTASGQPTSEIYAGVLAERYPPESIPAIITGARTCQDSHVRSDLTRMLWGIRDPRCRDFFVEEAKSGPTSFNRIQAAYGLRYLHDSAGTTAAIEEWHKLTVTGSKTFQIPLSDETPESGYHVLEYLVTSAAPEAALSVSSVFSQIPVEWRQRALDPFNNAIGMPETPTGGTRLAVEDLLSGALEDKTLLPDRARQTETGLLVCGRVCDLAAIQLSAAYGTKYSFDTTMPASIRDIQCATMRNQRLKELHEPLLQIPPRPPLKRPTQEQARRIIATEWEPDTAPPAASFLARIQTLRGKNLSTASIIALFAAYAAAPQSGTRGLELSISRNSSFEGVTLRARLMPGKAPGPQTPATGTVFSSDRELSFSAPFKQLTDPLRWKWTNLNDAVDNVAHRSDVVPFYVRAKLFTTFPE